MKVINLFGAPGSGKSTLRSGLFYELKMNHYEVEDVTEYAKDMVWEERHNIFQDQLYMLAKQNRKLLRLNNKVDYVVTDSPIILGTAYLANTVYDNTLKELIKEVFLSYDNYNILINRRHRYNENGRNQNEQESDILADSIKKILNDAHINFVEIESNAITPKELMKMVLKNV